MEWCEVISEFLQLVWFVQPNGMVQRNELQFTMDYWWFTIYTKSFMHVWLVILYRLSFRQAGSVAAELRRFTEGSH